MNAFELISARTLNAALTFVGDASNGKTLVKAGGVDVVDRLKERLETPARVLNLLTVRDISAAIVKKGDVLSIGPLATLAEVAAAEPVVNGMRALSESAGEAATPQIRNVATVGGNLCQKPRCWYYRSHDFHCLKKGGSTCYAVEGDNRLHAIFGAGACHIVHPSNVAVPLMAHGASVRVVKMDGAKRSERTVSLDEFYRVPANPQDDEHTLAAGELIAEVTVPSAMMGPKSSFTSVREKQSFDWPLVACAVNLNDKEHPRVVLGAVAPIPWRLKNVEALIAGKTIDEELIAKAKKAAIAGAAPMRHNGYKVQLVSEMVGRALAAAGKQA